MRAVLYCRVSTLEQVENLSLSTQESACRAYCARESYDVDAVFVDRGESAKTIARPEFQRLLAHCRQHRGRLHAVVVYGLSRFSRSATDHHAIAAMLRGLGIVLRSVTEPIDDSPAGRLMETILSGMHQFDNDQKSARSLAGMRAATDRGRWVWKAPLGYRQGGKREPSLIPVPELAALLAEAWRTLAATTATVPAVLEQLRAAGVVGRRGSALSSATLHSILRNPVYTGRLESPKLGASTPGDWAALVDEGTFTAVRLKLAKAPMAPARANRREHDDFPLRRFVACGACLKGLTGSWTTGRSKRYAYYHCPSGCKASRVTRADLEAAWLAYLDTIRPEPWRVALTRGIILATLQAARDAHAVTRVALDRQADEARRRLRVLDEAYIFEKAIDRATYAERRQEVLERLTAAESERSNLSAEGLDAESYLSLAEACHTQGSRLWTTARTVSDRIRLQWALCPSGMTWAAGRTWNRAKGSGLYEIGPVDEAENGLVAHPAATWHRVCLYLEPWRVFAESGGAAMLAIR